MQGPLCIWPCSRPAMSILSSTRHACPTKDLDQLIACPPLHTMRRPLCRRWVQQRSPTPPIPSFQPSATISTILQYDIIIPTRNIITLSVWPLLLQKPVTASSVGRVGSAGLLIGPTRAAAPACRHHRASLASRGRVAQRDQPASLLKVRRHLQHMIMPFVTFDKHACAFVPQVTGSPTCLWSQLSLHQLMETSPLCTWMVRIGS